MASILERYISTLFERELGLGKAIAPFVPIPAIPFAPNVPSPFNFDTRRRTNFPIYKTPSPVDPDLIIQDEPDGSEAPPEITIETITGNLSSYLNEPSTPQSFIDQQLGIETSKELASGQDRVTGMGGALTQFASLSGLSASMLDAISEKSKQNLENIAAQAALGIPGYGIGRVNNQTVGVSPGNRLSGTIPTNLTTEQMNQITDKLTGQSGALGPAKAEYSVAGGRFDMSKPQTQAMIDFERTVLDAKGLTPDLKSTLLGYDRLTNPFERSRMPTNYYTITPFEQIQADIISTTQNREGMDSTSGSLSMGLETDVVAQDTMNNPMGINIGIDMANITGPTTTVDTQGYDLGGGYGGPTGGPSGLDASSGIGSGGYSDNESGDNQGSDGFGGGGWTAYGGKIGNSDKGFVAKTQTIKGVGLIKPEETFVETDMVRDRFEFDAADGDYVVNGPASKENESEIIGLVNSAINELKKEGVDIRVGNPKIKDKNKVPLIVASSEIYIPKVVAEKIGYPILEKINESGKAEVTRLKNELGDSSSDEDRYEAYEGMRVRNPQQGFLFRRPELNLTNPNTDRPQEDAFVPGISDEPIEMKPDDERFFRDYSLRDIKEAIYDKEMKGYKDRGYIFTGVGVKGGKGSSAFGTMQITYSTLEDFIKRSQGYKEFPKELKDYTKAVAQQGRDKVNLEVNKALYRGDKKIPLKKVSNDTRNKLKALGQGVIPQEVHKKYYDKLADAVLRQKLKDYKDKGIRPFLESYGEGKEYGDDVYNILRDKIQIKSLDNN